MLGRSEDAIETAQYDERQNDLAIFGLLEIATQDFRDGPDKAAETPDIGIRPWHYFPPRSSSPAD